MTWDEVYKVLYNEDSSCNHSPENLKVFYEIVKRANYAKSDKLLFSKVDRWNLYKPDFIHIVFYAEVKGVLTSFDVTATFSTFVSIRREFKLEELGI